MANANFTCVLDAWREGKRLYGRMHYYRSGSFFYQDQSFPNPTMNLAGTTYTDTDFGNRVRSGIYVGDVYSTTFSRTVAGTGDRTVTWSAGSGTRSDFAGTWSKTVNFPTEYSAPTGFSVSVVQRYPEAVLFNVSVSSYGNPSSASGRWIEAGLAGQNSWTSPSLRSDAAYNVSSAQIYVSNSSTKTQTLTIRGNTNYYYGGYAWNTQKGTKGIFGNVTTLAYPPSMSVKETTSDSAIIEYSLKADGGKYAKNVQYSMDDGTTWVTAATINSNAATTGTFTINNLTADTSYHLKTRVSTNAGETAGNDLSFNTFQDIRFYGSVNGLTTNVNKLYFSRNKKTKVVKKLYGPDENGEAKLIYKSQF